MCFERLWRDFTCLHLFSKLFILFSAFTDDTSWRKRFNTGPLSLSPSDDPSRNYRTVTGAEQPKWKNALDSLQSMFKGNSEKSMLEKHLEGIAIAALPAAGQDVTDYFGSQPR